MFEDIHFEIVGKEGSYFMNRMKPASLGRTLQISNPPSTTGITTPIDNLIK